MAKPKMARAAADADPNAFSDEDMGEDDANACASIAPKGTRKLPNWHYFTPQGAANLARYEYHGSDASLMYHYLVSPTAQWLVDHVLPPWLAPNTITLAGLLVVVFAHLCMLWYSPNMAEEAPRWVYWLAAVSLFVYQVLDAADGKQARKTHTSSPLGLLFDHGCDAFNVIVSACTFAATLQLGSTYWSLLMFLGPSTVFFFATWEEYHTGTLDLPLINGANEGLAIMYSLYSLTAILGPSFWHQPNMVVPALQNNHAFTSFMLSSAAFQCLLSVRNVVRCERKAKRSVVDALTRITPFILMIALSAFWVLRSPSDVFAAHPRLILWTVGLQYTKMTMHVMLAHMCHEPYRLLRKTFGLQLAIGFALVIGVPPFGHVELAVYVFFVLSFAAYAHMCFFAVTDLAKMLGIRAFSVKKPATKTA